MGDNNTSSPSSIDTTMVEPTDWLSAMWANTILQTSDYTSFCVITFLWHEVVFWLCNAPFILFHFVRIPFIERFKLQKEHVSNEQFFKILAWVAGTHLFIHLPSHLTSLDHWKMFNISRALPLPSWHTIIIQLFLLMLAEDLLFYFSHRLLHTPFLYRHVHHVHHRTTNTFSLASEYAHPVEIVFSNILPVVLPAYLLRVHLFTYLLWIAVMLVETTIAHCGYHFPLLTPFGVPDDKAHTYHHKFIQSNYGSWFALWDRLLATRKCWDKRAQQNNNKSSTSSSDRTSLNNNGIKKERIE